MLGCYSRYVELTQIMTSCHDILYPSRERTQEMVRRGEYYKVNRQNWLLFSSFASLAFATVVSRRIHPVSRFVRPPCLLLRVPLPHLSPLQLSRNVVNQALGDLPSNGVHLDHLCPFSLAPCHPRFSF